jgi:hypothetical protein
VDGSDQLYIPREGFTSIKTRRSACFSVMSSPACTRLGRILLYSQTWGVHFGFGSGGFRRAICAQSGFVCSPSAVLSSCSVACVRSRRRIAAVSVAVEIELIMAMKGE